MSDRPKDDPWTQGTAPDAAASSAAAPTEGAEALREQQRLKQIELMDRWIGGVLVEQRRTRRWKLFFRFAWLLLFMALIGSLAYAVMRAPVDGMVQGQHIGVVEINGVIDSEAPANADRIIDGVKAAWEAPNSVAVVLHINSPGGSPVQSQRVYDAVRQLRESGDKPIIAVVEDIAASGAYYMAAASDEIVAAPASLVGSIGVIYSGFGLGEAIGRLGVERRVFTAGDNKAFLDPFSEIRPEQRDFWQEVLDTTHRQFIDDVKAGRGERLSDDPDVFSGLIWTGEQARELGLVDRIGSIEDEAREQLEEPALHDYTPPEAPFDRISRELGLMATQLLGLSDSASPMRYQLP
ncbi:signal peptide peptidase SppA [Halomonas huangheensis]|uniref:Peptidase S49 domain-containing protein n=1 Tax=Halomonas huangheensis TaxID=1178482 RepID=W1N1D0_9GAMM|nr:signal peptide peptidase SppA [Halomonas huangheensis]ALM52169.1 signal peptidase [Halomonas huangheensis]ERL49382.1 hypothetical protein BJB45_06280 [Halomonas huangheensis]